MLFCDLSAPPRVSLRRSGSAQMEPMDTKPRSTSLFNPLDMQPEDVEQFAAAAEGQPAEMPNGGLASEIMPLRPVLEQLCHDLLVAPAAGCQERCRPVGGLHVALRLAGDERHHHVSMPKVARKNQG